MKKILAVILALILVCSCCAAAAEEAGDKYEQLTVGVTTAFNGNFLSDALGSNISDQDVRKLIHSYRLAEWDSTTGAYLLNDQARRYFAGRREVAYGELTLFAADVFGLVDFREIGQAIVQEFYPALGLDDDEPGMSA